MFIYQNVSSVSALKYSF